MGSVIQGRFKKQEAAPLRKVNYPKKVLLIRAVDMMLVYRHVLKQPRQADFLQGKVIQAVTRGDCSVLFTEQECKHIPEVMEDSARALKLYRILYTEIIM